MIYYVGYLGYFGPIILCIISIIYYLVFYKPSLKILEKFITLLIFSLLLNMLLKNIIKQPRPSGEIPLFNKKRTQNFYGMPSGHAQQSAFITAFLINHSNNTLMKIFFIGMTILTVIQRYVYRAHSALQLAAGLLIGTLIGSSI